jgi:hypothetical protein
VEAGAIEYFDGVTVVQRRGLEIYTEAGIIALDREGDLIAFGETMETACRSMYATRKGRAVLIGRHEARRAAEETARQRALREANERAAKEAAETTAILFQLPPPKSHYRQVRHGSSHGGMASGT